MQRVCVFFTFLLICLTATAPKQALASGCSDELCQDLKLAIRSSPRLSVKRGVISKVLYRVGIESEKNPIEKIESSIHGINLEGPRFMIQAVADIYGQRPARSILLRAAKCKTPQCALAAVYGSRRALMKAMIVYFRHGLVFSIDQNYSYFASSRYVQAFNEVVWTPELVEIYAKDLNKMPHALRGNGSVIKIYLGSTGGMANVTDVNREFEYMYDSTAIRASSQVPELNRQISWGPNLSTSAVLIHELAHRFQFLPASSKLTQQFEDLSGWKQDAEKALQASELLAQGKRSDQTQGWYLTNTNACFVSEYARTNPWEDFADTAAYFSTAPDILKAKCPLKYDFMKRLFQ